MSQTIEAATSGCRPVPSSENGKLEVREPAYRTPRRFLSVATLTTVSFFLGSVYARAGCPSVALAFHSASADGLSKNRVGTTAAAGKGNTQISTAGQVMVAGATVHVVAKPVIGEKTGAAATSVPRTGLYVPTPRAYPRTTWSTLPRSSWDLGGFPPYSN